MVAPGNSRRPTPILPLSFLLVILLTKGGGQMEPGSHDPSWRFTRAAHPGLSNLCRTLGSHTNTSSSRLLSRPFPNCIYGRHSPMVSLKRQRL